MTITQAVALPTDMAETTEQRAQRLERLQQYRAQDHLKRWTANDRGHSTVIEYYPAAWRLFELSLRYPAANFACEIEHIDPAKDFVVVRARLYLGANYDASPKKAEAFKQGKLSLLDKVETAAKARCARDFGIGTEHALDMNDAEVDEIPVEEPLAREKVIGSKRAAAPIEELDEVVRQRLNEMYTRAHILGLCSNAPGFLKYASQVLERNEVSKASITLADLERIESDLSSREQTQNESAGAA